MLKLYFSFFVNLCYGMNYDNNTFFFSWVVYIVDIYKL